MTENHPTIRVVHLEDMCKDIEQVAEVLKNSGHKFDIRVVDSMAEFKRSLKEFNPELIISHSLPSCNSLKAMDIVRRLGLKIPFIVVARPITEYYALEAMKAGASDYVLNDRYLRLPHIIINVLKRCRLEKELKEKENKYNDLMEHSPANTVLLDKDGNILKVNSAWKRFADNNGFKGKKYGIGTNYLAAIEKSCIVSDESGGKIAQALRDMTQGKLDHFSEIYPCHSPDIKRWFRVIASRENSCEDSGIVIMHIDVTDRMLAEEERNTVNLQLKRRNADLEQFAFFVSHDLRGPVANIIGIADALKADRNNPEEDKKLKSHLSTSINKLDNVLKHLNDLLMVKNEGSEQMEIVYFSELTKEILLSFGHLMQDGKVDVRCDFSEVDEILTFRCYLHSILFNLISNSFKYRQPDTDLIIEINTKKTEDMVEIHFKDNGIGINLEKNGPYVFGLNQQFHPGSVGKGMGLYLVKTHVESLGGLISVSSEVNKGTEFRIAFENQLRETLKRSSN